MRQKWLQKPPLGTPINWSHPLAKGLVGFWAFQEGGGDLANDLSGNANHGTLKNMAFPSTAVSGWNAGRKGVGLKFDGTDDYADCGNDSSLNITDAITLSAWVKLNGLGAWQTIMAKGREDTFQARISSTNILSFKIFNSIGTYHQSDFSTLGAVSSGMWYHIVMGFDGSSLFAYLNGKSESDSCALTDIDTNSVILSIGARNAGTEQRLNGQIDQVRIYNRALSAEEIKTLYLYPYAGFQQPCTAWLYAAAAGGLSIPVAMYNYRRMRT